MAGYSNEELQLLRWTNELRRTTENICRAERERLVVSGSGDQCCYWCGSLGIIVVPRWTTAAKKHLAWSLLTLSVHKHTSHSTSLPCSAPVFNHYICLHNLSLTIWQESPKKKQEKEKREMVKGEPHKSLHARVYPVSGKMETSATEKGNLSVWTEWIYLPCFFQWSLSVVACGETLYASAHYGFTLATSL